MAQAGEKRSTRPTKTEPRKKRKREAVEVGAQQPSQAQPVSVDGLQWKEVDLPDRLEDAEGFLGLEEVDDVQIIRDGHGKGPRFQVCLSLIFESFLMESGHRSSLKMGLRSLGSQI